jgi:lambda repressor-like predicted transcriptional regulator
MNYLACMFALELEKVKLKNKGHSYRSAARELGITYQYLSDVLNGHHTSWCFVDRATIPACY